MGNPPSQSCTGRWGSRSNTPDSAVSCFGCLSWPSRSSAPLGYRLKLLIKMKNSQTNRRNGKLLNEDQSTFLAPSYLSDLSQKLIKKILSVVPFSPPPLRSCLVLQSLLSFHESVVHGGMKRLLVGERHKPSRPRPLLPGTLIIHSLEHSTVLECKRGMYRNHFSTSLSSAKALCNKTCRTEEGPAELSVVFPHWAINLAWAQFTVTTFVFHDLS